MIICVSANPAIDRRVRVKTLRPGAVNRAFSAESLAGGKAAHVAMAAKALGEDVVWIGFIGGVRGDELKRQLTEMNIRVVGIRTEAQTRTNDEIIDEFGNITEILEPGGPIAAGELAQLYAACEREMESAAVPFQLVLSGSLPPNVPDDLYSHLIDAAHQLGGQAILDTSGQAFLTALAAGPDLAKPNRQEAEHAVGFGIGNTNSALAAAEQLRELGARSVAISLGGDGVVWTDGRVSIAAVPPRVEVVSTVGSGDASVAGFAAAASRKMDVRESVQLSVACGTANCLAALPGQIDVAEVERLRALVKVRELVVSAKSAPEAK